MRPLKTVDSHGAQALSGRGAGLAADLSTVFEIATVLDDLDRRSRGGATRTREAVLLAAAAAVAALVAFDKVLSPQYLIWIVPFVPLVRGARGFVASLLLFIALGLTQTWFPRHYWPLAIDSRARRSRGTCSRATSRSSRSPACSAGAQPRTRFRSRKSTLAGRSASRRMR